MRQSASPWQSEKLENALAIQDKLPPAEPYEVVRGEAVYLTTEQATRMKAYLRPADT